MSMRIRMNVASIGLGVTLLVGTVAVAQQAAQSAPATGSSQAAPVAQPGDSSQRDVSAEQGQTHLPESFDWDKRMERIKGQRREALKDTTYSVQFRSMYMDRDKSDGGESQAWAAGGSAGLKSGYFRDLLSLGTTAYTSQKLMGDEDKDGTLLLKPGQESYSVLGELYGDVLITDDVHAYVGRKAYDTPYINRNDVRMTPNTFEAATFQGKVKLGGDASSVKYGAGYFDAIKERNSDDFVSMSKDAGATVERGVYTAGANYEQGAFSIGAIDYYSEDIINIAYGETKYALTLGNDRKAKLAAQYSDQQSAGDELLKGDSFSAHQAGVKGDVTLGGATLTAAYTLAGGDANMQNPWSGYPGYTSVQVEDFNRDGEGAFLMKANYAFDSIKGLSAYALCVLGTDPDSPKDYSKNEYDGNVQWSGSQGLWKGLTLRARYALVTQNGGEAEDTRDFRVMCYYDFPL